MLKTNSPVAALAALALAVASCTESTVIGADGFTPDALAVSFTDTVPVSLATREAATSLAIDILTAGAVNVGCISSGPTGETRATLGMELVGENSQRLDLEAVTVDSVVLVLPIDTTSSLGDRDGELSLTVAQAAPGTIELEEATFADSLARGEGRYGSYVGALPSGETAVNTFVGDTVRVDSVSPQLRISLNGDFRDDIVEALRSTPPGDTLLDDEVFIAGFPGIIISGSACGDLLPAVSTAPADAPQLGVTIYYTEGAVQRQYRLVNRRLASNGSGLLTAGAPLRVAYDNVYDGSPAATLLAGGRVDGIGAVVQGLQGLNTEVMFDDLDFGDGRGINFAELVIPVVPEADVPLAATPIDPYASLVLRLPNSSGDLVDYSAVPGQLVYTRGEGGALETVVDPRGGVDSVQVYRFNVTTLLQEIVAGQRTPSVFIAPLASNLVAGESALVGERDDGLRARLRVITTELP